MSMQNFWGVKEVHYGIVQVVNKKKTIQKPNNKTQPQSVLHDI